LNAVNDSAANGQLYDLVHDEWLSRLHERMDAQILAAQAAEKRGIRLGLAFVLLTATAVSLGVARLGESALNWGGVVAAGLTAAILGILSERDYRTQALAHRTAATAFQVLRRDAEVMLRLDPRTDEFRWEFDRLRSEWRALSKVAPYVPSEIHATVNADRDAHVIQLEKTPTSPQVNTSAKTPVEPRA
jgi:hypothetical protein